MYCRKWPIWINLFRKRYENGPELFKLTEYVSRNTFMMMANGHHLQWKKVSHSYSQFMASNMIPIISLIPTNLIRNVSVRRTKIRLYRAHIFHLASVQEIALVMDFCLDFHSYRSIIAAIERLFNLSLNILSLFPHLWQVPGLHWWKRRQFCIICFYTSASSQMETHKFRSNSPTVHLVWSRKREYIYSSNLARNACDEKCCDLHWLRKTLAFPSRSGLLKYSIGHKPTNTLIHRIKHSNKALHSNRVCLYFTAQANRTWKRICFECKLYNTKPRSKHRMRASHVSVRMRIPSQRVRYSFHLADGRWYRVKIACFE